MTKMSTLSAVIILSAAVAMPAFAQDEAGVRGPGSRDRLETHHSGARDGARDNDRGENQMNGPSNVNIDTEEHERNLEDFGISGKAPSRVGGEDPYLNPE
jgi:hypothetical protein